MFHRHAGDDESVRLEGEEAVLVLRQQLLFLDGFEKIIDASVDGLADLFVGCGLKPYERSR